MMKREIYQIKTDKAWNKVYARIEKDGLPEGKGLPHKRLYLRQWSLAAAAVLLLGLVLSITIHFKNDNSIDQKFLLVKNQETSFSLVTTLEDGSIVYLAEKASLQYPQHFSSNKRSVKLNGNAYFNVAHNKAKPFLIETNKVHITVIGTAFNIKSSNKSPFELSVSRGEVKVSIQGEENAIHVKAGETVTLHAKSLQLSQTKDNEQFVRYTERMRFKDEKLGDIIRVINSQSQNLQIQTIPSLENRTLTVSFSNDTPETMAELICLALNLQSVKKDNIITIFE